MRTHFKVSQVRLPSHVILLKLCSSTLLNVSDFLHKLEAVRQTECALYSTFLFECQKNSPPKTLLNQVLIYQDSTEAQLDKLLAENSVGGISFI